MVTPFDVGIICPTLMSTLIHFVALSCEEYGRQCDPPNVACRQCDEWPEEQIEEYRGKDKYERKQSESPHTAPPAGVELGRGLPAPPMDQRRF